MSGAWNLRRVRDEEGQQRICEVFYGNDGRPWGYTGARLRDIVRFWRDWTTSPVLLYPGDFNVGEVSDAGPCGDISCCDENCGCGGNDG